MKLIKIILLLLLPVFCFSQDRPTAKVHNPMSASMRQSISPAKAGMFVYDRTAQTYYYYDGASWISWGSSLSNGDNIYNENGTLTSDRDVNTNGNDLIITNSSTADASQGTLTLIRNHEASSSRRVGSLVLQNNTTFGNATDLQRGTALIFRTDNRGYISWENDSKVEKWIAGRNSGNDFPIYDSESQVHRVYMESGGQGRTFISSVGTGRIVLNSQQTAENVSAAGAEIHGDFYVKDANASENIVLRKDGVIEFVNLATFPANPASGFGLCVVGGKYYKFISGSWVEH